LKRICSDTRSAIPLTSRCSKKKRFVCFSDFAASYPELAEEWHPEKNIARDLTVPSFSKGAVWWKCSVCGGAWQDSLNNRIKGQGCPYCLGKKLFPGYNDFATRYPELSKEWHPVKNGTLTPSDILYNHSDEVWWQCPSCGREWLARPKNRAVNSRCLGCIGKQRKRR